MVALLPAPVAKLDKAPAYEAGDCWFESSRVRQKDNVPHIGYKAAARALNLPSRCRPEVPLNPSSTDPSEPDGSRPAEPSEEKQFQGWRLLRFLGVVVLSLAIVSAVVDWLVLGSLLERAF